MNRPAKNGFEKPIPEMLRLGHAASLPATSLLLTLCFLPTHGLSGAARLALAACLRRAKFLELKFDILSGESAWANIRWSTRSVLSLSSTQYSSLLVQNVFFQFTKFVHFPLFML